MLASEGLFFALGALLEASGAEKKTLDRPLAALGKISRQVSARKKTLGRLLAAPREISRQVSIKRGFPY